MLWNEVFTAEGEDAFVDAVRATAPDVFAHIRGGDVKSWAAFWSIHLRLWEIREISGGVEFVVGAESILPPDALFRDSGWFVERLNEGLESRGWSDVGEFSAVEENLIHRLNF